MLHEQNSSRSVIGTKRMPVIDLYDSIIIVTIINGSNHVLFHRPFTFHATANWSYLIDLFAGMWLPFFHQHCVPQMQLKTNPQCNGVADTDWWLFRFVPSVVRRRIAKSILADSRSSAEPIMRNNRSLKLLEIILATEFMHDRTGGLCANANQTSKIDSNDVKGPKRHNF